MTVIVAAKIKMDNYLKMLYLKEIIFISESFVGFRNTLFSVIHWSAARVGL
jgi:hypothetical protein